MTNDELVSEWGDCEEGWYGAYDDGDIPCETYEEDPINMLEQDETGEYARGGTPQKGLDIQPRGPGQKRAGHSAPGAISESDRAHHLDGVIIASENEQRPETDHRLPCPLLCGEMMEMSYPAAIPGTECPHNKHVASHRRPSEPK